MSHVFADAFYYFAILNPNDTAHDRALAYATAHDDPVVTTAWVLTELADGLAATGHRRAFSRLKNGMGRVEASWRPASPDEGFEIVRRRLFQTLAGDQFVARDAVGRAFVDYYGSQQQEFPSECREADYECRVKMAFPIPLKCSTGSTMTGPRSTSFSARGACCG